jgi:flagellar hook-length control protein FliK
MPAPSIASLPPQAPPAAPDAAPRAPAAHPFAELLRQNRLATAEPAPAPAPVPSAHDEAPSNADGPDAEATDPPETTPARPATTPTRARPKVATQGAVSETAAREAELANRREDKTETTARTDAANGAATPADVLAQALAHLHGMQDQGGGKNTTATGDDDPGSTDDVRRGGEAAGRAAPANANDVRATAGRDDARTRFETALATQADAATTAAATAEASLAPAAAFAAEGSHGLRADGLASLAPTAGAAALASPASDSAAAPGAPVDVTLATPVNSPDFAQALGVQVSVLAKDGVQKAELHLNPAETGPISVHIAIEGTQARVEFGADAAATRHAIEAGLPELAGALREAGLTLHGGGVSSHAGGRERNDGEAGNGRGRALGAAGIGATADAGRATRPVFVRAGGVDVYA